MWFTETAMLLETQVTFLDPVKLENNWNVLAHESKMSSQNVVNFLKTAGKESNFAKPLDLDKNIYLKDNLFIGDTPKLKLTKPKNRDNSTIVNIPQNNRAVNLNFGNLSSQEKTEMIFIPGNSSWETNTIFGAVGMDGKFDAKANLSRGNTFWKTDTGIGTVKVKANFDSQIKFTGGIASWQAKTAIGLIAVSNKFDRETNLIGRTIDFETNTNISTVKIKANLDNQTDFTEGTASLQAKTFFGLIGISSNFDRETNLTNKSIDLGTDVGFGSVKLKANFDAAQLAGGTASWNLKTGETSVNLDADIKANGDYSSSLKVKMPF